MDWTFIFIWNELASSVSLRARKTEKTRYLELLLKFFGVKKSLREFYDQAWIATVSQLIDY